MSWLFKTKHPKPDYTDLQLQTATSTLPVPIVWGKNKVADNVIWYQNFNSTYGGGKGGKGGGGGGGSQGYTYYADIIMALCEGPISSIGTIWKDQSVYTASQLGLTEFDGTTPQSPWGYLVSAYPSQALSYQGTCYTCAASYNLGSTAGVGNHNFEVAGILYGSGFNGVDADPAQVIYDFLTNAQYGAGFDAASIDTTTLYGAGGDASLQTYCAALGIAFSPALVTAEQASSILTRWLMICNCAAVWSGGKLKFIPYDQTPIASGNITISVSATVPSPPTLINNASGTPTIVVAPPGTFVSDGGVVYTETGVALTYIGTSAPTSAGEYGISPAGSYLFSGSSSSRGDVGYSVTITYTYSNPVAYAPNTTAVYNLTDLDFLPDDNKDPVQATRVDPFSLSTIQRIDVLSRNNQYGGTPVEARDQSQIEIYGPRVGTAIQANEICDDVVIGPIVAQTILQRQLYVRAHFKFKLSWEYCLLDPMDIVTITDANLGLSNYPVRIITLEEDDKGLISVTAEELAAGASTPVLYVNNGSSGFQPSQGSAAAAVNTPLIFEPPTALTGDIELWVGASGGSGGVNDGNWGGAFVWLSFDGTTYSQVATITQSLNQGTLTATLGAAAGWDTSDTLSVNLAESAGVLNGTTITGAQQGATLCLVDNELLSFENETLTSAYNYDLTNMQRGLWGTTGAAHSSGAQFARLDGVVKQVLPANYIGITLYLKFQSFNVFGAGVQDISTCTPYTYTPNGGGASDPIAQQLLSGFALDLGLTTASATTSDDFGTTVGGVLSIIDLGTVP